MEPVCVTIPYPSSGCPLSPALPLLPAEIISSSKHHEKAKDGEEDDGVPCHHQATGTQLNLEKTHNWDWIPSFWSKYFQQLTERHILLEHGHGEFTAPLRARTMGSPKDDTTMPVVIKYASSLQALLESVSSLRRLDMKVGMGLRT